MILVRGVVWKFCFSCRFSLLTYDAAILQSGMNFISWYKATDRVRTEESSKWIARNSILSLWCSAIGNVSPCITLFIASLVIPIFLHAHVLGFYFAKEFAECGGVETRGHKVPYKVHTL